MIGTTADAAKFEVVKEELGKHFATQSWSDGVDAAMAFDTLIEPSYHEPEEPGFPLKMMYGVDGMSEQVTNVYGAVVRPTVPPGAHTRSVPERVYGCN